MSAGPHGTCIDKDVLRAYAEDEFKTAKQLAQDSAISGGGLKSTLRRLYGLPLDTPLVYVESGDLSTVNYFPADTKLIMPVFPSSENDLRATVGHLDTLRTLIDAGRIFPIIQNPAYYYHCDHLKFLFERNTPSNFIRGPFVYSAVLGLDPNDVVERSELGLPTLPALNRLMAHCNSNTLNQSWLDYAKKHETCWEYRYRRDNIRDDRFYERLRNSLCYRYASVAICIGQDNADEIIAVFPPDTASRILLHLHILFDHVMCHGVGSDFVVVVGSNTPDGIDFQYSRTTGVTRPHEVPLASGRIPLPEGDDDYVRGLLREEHFLREIDFNLVSQNSLRDIQDQLSRQFSLFRGKVEKYAKQKNLIGLNIQITLYILSLAEAAAMSVGASGDSTRVIAGLIAGFKAPWLADIVEKRLQKLLRDRLASYVIKPTEKHT